MDLQKKANSDTFQVETEASYLKSTQAFSKNFRNLVASRIENVIKDISVVGNYRNVYNDVMRHCQLKANMKFKEVKLVQVVVEEYISQ